MSRRPNTLPWAAAVVCLLGMRVAAAAVTSSPPIALENEFIRMVVNPGTNEAGRFSIRTTGGDISRPSSKNKHLIFGGNTPWTSYSTVKIDGTPYIVGGPTHRRAGSNGKYGQTITAPTLANNLITYSEKFGDIEVTQELSFVRGMSTRMLDTVGITYKITNRSSANHEVGLRMLLDTMCGDNDAAPIRAGRQAITTATVLTGKDVPDFWQAFDSLANPTVISQGSLRGDKITPPDQLLFADWGTLADDPWVPALTPGQGFTRKGETEPDTAAAMVWNPVILEPGKTKTYVSYYGIGEVSLKAGQLTLGLTAPAETTFEHERTQTFTLTGYLQNAGGYDARDVTTTLTVPEGLTLVSGNKVKESQRLLKPNETVQRSWIFIANGKMGGKLALTLAVTSSNIEANQITRQIQVAVPNPHLRFAPTAQRVMTQPDEPTPVIMEVNLAPAVSLYGASVTIKFDPNVVLPFDVSRGRAFIEEGRQLYWHVDKSQIEKGLLTLTGRRIDAHGVSAELITQAEANLGTLKFRTVNPGKTSLSVVNAVLFDEKGVERPVESSAGDIEVVNVSAGSPESHHQSK